MWKINILKDIKKDPKNAEIFQILECGMMKYYKYSDSNLIYKSN